MKSIVVTIETRDQSVAASEPDQPFLYTLRKVGGDATGDTQLKSMQPTVRFPDVVAGEYVITASRFGFEASTSKNVVIEDDGRTEQVPVSISASVELPTPAPQAATFGGVPPSVPPVVGAP